MRCRQLIVLSFLADAPFYSLAKPLIPPWDDIRIKHTWNTIPHNWETLGHPPAGTLIDIHVSLKPQNEDALIDALYAVSDPKSPKYGAHLSKEQVAQLVAPHPDTLQLINTWLEHHNVPPSSISTSHGGDWLTITDVPVSQANEMLGASYQLYRHTGTNNTTILRTIGYALPAVLHPHVRTVIPTTYFASTRTLSQTPQEHSAREFADMSSTKVLVTPSALRSLYRTITYEPTATDRNILGVAGFRKQFPSETDLTAFMAGLRMDALDATFTVLKINRGMYNPRYPGYEANLNMQYAQAIAYPTPHVFYSIGGTPQVKKIDMEPAPGDIFLEWLNYMIDEPNVPQTISVPYGGLENDVPQEYAKAVCDLLAKVGARGVSVILPSGDEGVGRGDCKAKDSSGRVQFIPEFPATCPFVTTVGGTTGLPPDPEIAASLSGGGFSNYFSRPPYQRYKVPIFLRPIGSQYDGLYNPAGRGIPDISAQSLGFPIIKRDKPFTLSGTSASVPTVAGIISLLNDFLLSTGRRPLGFLNPWLYTIDNTGFNDIISGSNPGCGTTGFEATTGWDPVTGLGTLNFATLQGMLLRALVQRGNESDILGTSEL